jgi:RHS repeat-associated protein
VFRYRSYPRHVKEANGNSIGKYYYDGEGKRVKKVTPAEPTIFVYSAGKLAAEYSTQAPPSNPTINYTATDQLGSPRVITDKYGTVVSRRDFMPFGEELYADGSHRTTAGKYSLSGEDAVRKRFTGYEKDKETGLDFAEARYYNNQHGRFTAVDPLLTSGKSVNPQTFNRYVYVLNGPLVKTDPTGLQTGTVPVINGGVLARQDSERCYECPTLEWQNSSTNFGPFGSVRSGQFSPVIYDTQIDWSPQSQGFADWIELRNNPGRSPEGLSFLEYAGRGSGKGFVNFFPNLANSAIKAGGIPAIRFMIPDIPTFEYTNWTESIAGHATEFVTGGAIFGMTGGVSATKTIRTPTQLSWIRGVEGEAAVGISGSKETIPSLTGTAKFRVPDRLTPITLDEVKNVQRLSYTRQIKDFRLFSQVTNRQFTIFVRPTTTFSGPLRKLIEEGTIFTQNIP